MEKKEPGANSGASNTAKKSRRNDAGEETESSNSASAQRPGPSSQSSSSSGSHHSSGSVAQAQAQAASRSAQSNSGSPDNPAQHTRNHNGQQGQRQRNQIANGVAGYLNANSNGSNSHSRNGSPRTKRTRNQSHSRERDRERCRDADNAAAADAGDAGTENESASNANRASNESSPQPTPEDQAEALVALKSASVSPSPQQNASPGQHGSLAAKQQAVAAAVAAAYNWQSSKTSLKERLAFMFNNEIMADVHFIVGKGSHTQRIPAHKFVLSIGSAVFDAMFNGGMATKSEEVELPDVEPAAFLALLKFLYSDEVQIGPETVMTTLYTAKKYVVPALEKACVDFLKRNLGSDNAFMLLTQARLFDEPQLAALCLETIDKNTTEALAAEGFCDIDLNTLCVVLERDTLGIRECKLFSAVCRWSEAECLRQNMPTNSEHRRQVLGHALQLIRFPLMTVEEFAVGAAQSGILSDREVVELFLHFTVNPKPTVKFLDTPRCCLTGKEQVVSRFCMIESRWGYSGTSDRIRFMVNRRIFVVGFGLYGSIHGPSEYQVYIQIIHADSGKVHGQNDSSFQCDGSNSTFRVMFKEPVEIHPNTNYTACATLKGSDSFYGTKGLRKVTHESVTSGKVTFQFAYAAGNNNGTSVEDGQLPEIIFYT